MQALESDGNANSDAKELPRLHGMAEEPFQRIAARILHHKRRPPFVMHHLQGASRPSGIHLRGKRIRVMKSRNGFRHWLFQSWRHYKHSRQTSIPLATEQNKLPV